MFCRADTSNRRDENCNGVLAYLKLKTDNSIRESLALDEEGKLCTLTEPKTDIISRKSSSLNEECKPCTLTEPKTDIISRESSPLNEECKPCTLTEPKTDIISRESSPLNEECKPCTLTKVEDLRPIAISNIVDSSNSTNGTIEKAESQENTLNCKECGKKYQHYSSLYKHMRQVHSTVSSGRITCKEHECPFSCHYISQLREHLRVKHGIKMEEEQLMFSNHQGNKICTFY